MHIALGRQAVLLGTKRRCTFYHGDIVSPFRAAARQAHRHMTVEYYSREDNDDNAKRKNRLPYHSLSISSSTGGSVATGLNSRMISTKAVIAFVVSVVLALNVAVRTLTGYSPQKPKLSFSKSGKFKILQLTDLHFGEEPSTDWGPIQDRNTTTLIRLVLIRERPDLVVLSGDQLTGENVDANATVYYDYLANLLEEFKVPYALIFGNHDDKAYWKTLENGTDVRHAAKTDRLALMRSNQRHLHSLSQIGPSNVSGISNYALNVRNKKDNDSIQLQVMLLDSGGGSYAEEIVQDQLDWYRQQRLPNVAAVAFQHIPTTQFTYSYNDESQCSGFKGEDGIAPLENDPVGEIAFLQQYDANLHFMAVGHNHGNSYCCPTTTTSNSGNSNGNVNAANLHLCFGRHSGYGGYGVWERGARVYELTIVDPSSDNGMTASAPPMVSWKSWVRLDSGTIIDEYDPSSRR